MSGSISHILGLNLNPNELTVLQLCLRAALILAAALLMMRLAGRRFLARRNAFDVLLAFILGSMLSRAINGSAPIFGTVAVGFFVAGLHRLLTYAAYRSHFLGVCLKGEAERLITDGQPDESVMARHHVSRHDLEEDLRLEAAVTDPKLVKLAHLERNGKVSVQRRPQVADIAVAEGVQTVRVLIEG
jgi:uncharacterized membrane protein YcaP (DUF421 family)